MSSSNKVRKTSSNRCLGGRPSLRVSQLEIRLAPANFDVPNGYIYQPLIGNVGGLVAVINACNTNNAPDTITLAANGSYEFTTAYAGSNNALPVITVDSLSAPNANNTVTIIGNDATFRRLFNAVEQFRFLEVREANGTTSVFAKLIVDNLRFEGGSTTSGIDGGSLALRHGSAVLQNCMFINNSSNGSGGAIANRYGSFWSSAGQLYISNCSFENNTATESGGAVFSQGGTTTILGSTFMGNQSNLGDGGAIAQGGGSLEIINSTIGENRAESGGGVLIGGDATISFSTITKNKTFDGGGGGIRLLGSNADLIIGHSIVADNIIEASSSATSRDIAGDVVSNGYNFIGSATGTSGLVPTDFQGTSAQPLDPQLGPLQDNGGLTLTHMPNENSKAFNGGNPNVSGQPPLDQRGLPRIALGQIDIGAVEREFGIPTSVELDPINFDANLIAPSTISMYVEINNSGTTQSPAFEIDLYASTDVTIDTNDWKLPPSVSFPGIPGGGTKSMTYQVTLPPTLFGTLYFGGIVDSGSAIPEVNEANNSKADLTPIIVGPPDTTAPTTPAITGMSDDTGASSTDRLTNDTTPIFSWSASSDSGSGVAGYWWSIDDSTPETGGLFTTTLNATASVTLNVNHLFYVRAIDNAGILSNTSQSSFKIDTLSPTVISISPTDGGTVNAGPSQILVNFSEAMTPIVFPSNLTLGGPGKGSAIVSSADFIDADTARFIITGAWGVGQVTVQMTAGNPRDFAGNALFTYTTGDFTINPPPALAPIFVTGTGAGNSPTVVAYNADGSVRFSFNAYQSTFRGGVRVTTGDVTGDGITEIITAPGPGGGPHIRVFSSFDGQPIVEFFAYSASMTAGVFVATGDVNGDGRVDIITGAGVIAEPRVRVYNGMNLSTAPIRDFVAYPGYNVGVTVSAGDFNSDGKADIVTGPEAGNPHVKVFNGSNPALPLLRQFFAYNPIYPVGAYVSVGDVDGNGTPDIVTGAGAPGGPHVKAYSGVNGVLLREFFAYGSNFNGGVRVSARDLNYDGIAEIIAAPGQTFLNPPGTSNKVRVFNQFSTSYLDLTPFGSFLGGAYVG